MSTASRLADLRCALRVASLIHEFVPGGRVPSNVYELIFGLAPDTPDVPPELSRLARGRIGIKEIERALARLEGIA